LFRKFVSGDKVTFVSGHVRGLPRC